MNLLVLDHPLAKHKLSLLRDRKTPGVLFRALLEELGTLLAVEATRCLPVEAVSVDTPLERCEGARLRVLDPLCPFCARDSDCYRPSSR